MSELNKKDLDNRLYCPDCTEVLTSANPYTLKFFCKQCNEWKEYGIKLDRKTEGEKIG